MNARHAPLRCRSPRFFRGLTLLESLVVLAISALLVAGAMPFLGHVLARQSLALAVGDFIVAVDLARATARSMPGRVGIEPLQPGRWESGWRVYADRNGNGARDGDDIVLREFARAADRGTVSAHFGAWHADALSFDSLGNLRRPGSDGLVMGRFVFRQDASVRAVCFSAVQVRTVAAEQCS